MTIAFFISHVCMCRLDRHLSDCKREFHPHFLQVLVHARSPRGVLLIACMRRDPRSCVLCILLFVKRSQLQRPFFFFLLLSLSLNLCICGFRLLRKEWMLLQS